MERKNKRKEKKAEKDVGQQRTQGNLIETATIYMKKKKIAAALSSFCIFRLFSNLPCVLHFLPFYNLGKLVGLVNTVWHPPESADACIQAGWIQCSTLSVFSLNLLCTRRHFQS